jgi:transglutaminase-like putative cysteine protease
VSGRRSDLLPVAEVVAAGMAVAAVAAFVRLFDGSGGWVWPCLAAPLLSAALAAACRRRGWGVGSSAVVSAVGAVLFLSWVLYGETTAYGIPWGGTLSAVRADLGDAWALFKDVAAPAPAATGFVLAASAAAWGAAFLADWAAFRLWTPVEAVVPSATLFGFTCMLGTDRHRSITTAAWLGAALAFVLVHRVARQERGTSWLASDPRAGARSLIRVGAGLGAVALAAALVVGPALPGAARPALVDWKGGGGSGTRVTVSPLVDIRSRLVARESTVVFTVRSPARSYWRLTALDRFDGRIWSSEREFGKVDGRLPGSLATGGDEQTIRQEFSITGLESIWAPAAYAPVRVDDATSDLRYDAESATLIVDTDRTTSDGVDYVVESTLPAFDQEALAGASGRAPQDLLERYTELPDDFSEVAKTEATRMVNRFNRRPTPYQLALMLQDYFRNGAFTYDLSVQPGHDESAIDEFLLERRGYCEQFAGTYAAMARYLGLPARVAVGFTPGEEEEAGLFTVRGLNAHAWPEVYFVGVGWVPFEPTPGRGAPNAEQWTGVPEQQADPDDPASATTTTSTVPGGPTTSVALDRLPDEAFPDGGLSTSAPLGEREPSFGSKVWSWFRWVLVAVAAAAVLWLAGVPAARFLRRRARRAAATTPSERVLAAWSEAGERLTVLGVRRRPAETHREFAGRAAKDLDGESAGHLAALATLATAADFAPGGATDDEADEADRVVGRLAGEVAGRASTAQRWRWWLDPRPLLPDRRPRLRIADRSMPQAA